MCFIVALLLSVTVPYCFAENSTIIPDVMPQTRASCIRVIYITLVVDTESLFERYENPSKDPNHPTGIDDHAFVYLIAQDKYVVANQAKAELHIKAGSGDIINFMGTSESNGYENSVVLYHVSSSDKWTLPQCDLDYERLMTFPTSCNFKNEMTYFQKFAIVSTRLKRAGEISYSIRFAMYFRYRGKSKLYGFFYFDPKVTVTYD